MSDTAVIDSPAVADSTSSMARPDLRNVPKIVYEFDSADMNSGYMYPAMVRAFREADVAWYDAHLAPDYVVTQGDGAFDYRATSVLGPAAGPMVPGFADGAIDSGSLVRPLCEPAASSFFSSASMSGAKVCASALVRCSSA